MNWGRYLWLCVVWSLATLALSAAQMRPLSLAELSQRADLVALGTVQSKTCQRDGEGRIFTKVTFSVSEVWKGTATNTTLTIVHGGGVFGDVRAEVSGQVEYAVGKEVVAFLVFNPRGEPVTLGLAQGEFHVWTDAATGEKLARNLFHGAPTSVTTPSAITPAVAPPPASKLKLSELKQCVQAVKP